VLEMRDGTSITALFGPINVVCDIVASTVSTDSCLRVDPYRINAS